MMMTILINLFIYLLTDDDTVLHLFFKSSKPNVFGFLLHLRSHLSAFLYEKKHQALDIDETELIKVCYFFQDYAIVNVVPLRGVRIYAPLSRLQTGTKVSNFFSSMIMKCYIFCDYFLEYSLPAFL